MRAIQIAVAASGAGSPTHLFALCECGRVARLDLQREKDGWAPVLEIPDGLFESQGRDPEPVLLERP